MSRHAAMPSLLPRGVSKSPFFLEMERYLRSLRARAASPRTIRIYGYAIRYLDEYLARQGMPQDPATITREHVESFLMDGRKHFAPTTSLIQFRALNTFFRWLVDEGELTHSPMERMRAPAIAEQPPDVVQLATLRKLFKVCSGNDFRARRDTAILSILLDTGLRRGEVAQLTTESVDLDQQLLHVHVKGNRYRYVHYNRQTARDLDRYLRVRGKHPRADEPWLWISSLGDRALSDSGIYHMLQARCREAGIAPIHPHQMRHTFAHMWLANGGQEGDLMRAGGWKSREMLSRYGSSVADERAHEAHARFSPRDRL